VLKEFPKFIAAAVQASPEFRDKPVYFDSLATLANAVGQIKEAAANGAKLIVFLSSIFRGTATSLFELRKDPNTRISGRSITGTPSRSRAKRPTSSCKAAREANANVVIGINERDKKYGGRMYNSILYINNRGEILGTHPQDQHHRARADDPHTRRRRQEPAGLRYGLRQGQRPHLWRARPAAAQTVLHRPRDAGETAPCGRVPGRGGRTAGGDPAMTQAMAVSGACWCVLSCAHIPPEKQPQDFYDNTSFYQSFGGSAIVNPFGEIVVGPVRDVETILYADIDLKLNEMARGIINITGLYSRWDILSLLVRENTYEPMVSMESIEGLGLAGLAAGSSAAEVKDLREKVAELERKLQALQKPGE